MKIRNAQSKDINQLEIISKDRFKEKEMRLKFVNLVENNNYSVKIIEDSEDDILGFIVIKFIDMDLIEIYSLAVKKFYENKSLGLKLIQQVIKDYPNSKFILEVSEQNSAKFLYIKCGFKVDSIRKKYYKNEDAILMSYSKLSPGSEESKS